MASLNKVFLVGNLTRDPEFRQFSDDNGVSRFGMAMNRRFSTRGGEEREEVCFVDVEVFGRQAFACSQYLRKGAPALVEGRLHLDQWDDSQTGQRRSRLLVRAERVQFLGGPSRDTSFQEPGAQYGNAPRAQGAPPPRPNPGYGAAPQPRQAPPAPAYGAGTSAPPPGPRPAAPAPAAAPRPVPPQPPGAAMPPFDDSGFAPAGNDNTEDDIPF